MTEVRYERLHPAELRAAVERAPLAFLPVGTLEFHGEHLPFGVDSFEAHGLCLRAAELAGGVVLPPVYLASGCLDLPFTLSFEPELVEAGCARRSTSSSGAASGPSSCSPGTGRST